MDRYANFAELKANEAEGRDYRIHLRHGRTGIAIVAPHGGKIERGTHQLADAIAGDNHSFYSFEGIKTTLLENRILHITSNNFDEPKAIALISNSKSVISIHGAKGMHSAVYAGGLDIQLRNTILDSLSDLGFVAEHDPSPSRQGKGATNICNRGLTRQGLQLELTFGLRKSMFKPVDSGRRWEPTDIFTLFVSSVRRALEA